MGFPNGTLLLPTEPQPCGEAALMPVADRVLIAVASVAVLVCIRLLYDNGKSLRSCFTRIRGFYDIEYNWQSSAVRYEEFLLLLVPFGLIVKSALPGVPLWLAYLLPVVYVLCRALVSLLWPHRRVEKEWWISSRNSIADLFIPVCFLMILTVGLFALLGVPDTVRIATLKVEFALLIVSDTVVVARILSRCGRMSFGFLYLCALEFLPLGACAAIIQ